MRVEPNGLTTCFTIFDAPKLDPITVVMVDLGTGSGHLLVSCFGEAWSCYWGAMGGRRIDEFVRDLGAGYLAGKLIPYNSGRRILKREEQYVERIAGAIVEALASHRQGVDKP